MKNKKFIIGLGLLSILSLNSCREEFLESTPSETVASATAQQKLDGIYAMMVQTGTGGTTNHDDFGQKGYDIYMDMLSSDMALQGVTYGWYSGFSDYSDPVNNTRLVNYKPWRYYYRIIIAANQIIAELGGNEAKPSGQAEKYAMAQAKALRGYGYFYLTQLYLREYNPSGQGLPLYIVPTEAAAAPSTQAEVYAQITKDLQYAVENLNGFTRKVKSQIDQNVAKGLLVYAYGAMGNFNKVAELSSEIINTAGYPLTTKKQTANTAAAGQVANGGGFNDYLTPSWMWAFDLTLDNGLDLISWWGQVDRFTYSYAWAGDWKGIDRNLYNQISADDVRRNQFIWSGTTKNYPGNKFFAPQRTIGGQREIVTDYVFMRVDEFYLLAAEGLAKTGQEPAAKQILKKLLAERLSDASYVDNLSGKALQDEIYKQTRIELWGEGKSYLNLKRNKGSVTRGSNHLSLVNETFMYNDPRLTLSIPQQESLNNPNIPR